ncbi:MAG: 50S ribosomal protein L11 [Mycoplasmataceae bacterium]|nr:50S ribosomal protein L11 [Mycoplasmataceae bacterium]
MAKKVTRITTLQFQAGKAKPGPELAGLGIDMGGFTKEYNNETKEFSGDIIPVVITAYDDRSYEFVLKTTPASRMLLKAAGISKGAHKPPLEKVGTVTIKQLEEIAKYKMKDLNSNSLDAAVSMLKGTAINMGIQISDNINVVQFDKLTKEENNGQAI